MNNLHTLSGPGTSTPDDNTLIAALLHDTGTKVMSHPDALLTLQAYRNTGDITHRNNIVKGNIMLIVWLARRLLKNEVRVDDLIQEGIIGFMQGVDKYDFNRTAAASGNYKVANVAMIYARKAMQGFIDERMAVVTISKRVWVGARKAHKALELAVMVHETNGITIDLMLQDRPPSERVGALDMGTSESIEARPYTLGVTWFNTPENAEYQRRQRNYTNPIDAQHHRTYLHNPPPSPDQAREIVDDACRILADDVKQLVYSYYDIEGLPFDVLCRQLNITERKGVKLVRESIDKVKDSNLAACPR